MYSAQPRQSRIVNIFDSPKIQPEIVVKAAKAPPIDPMLQRNKPLAGPAPRRCSLADSTNLQKQFRLFLATIHQHFADNFLRNHGRCADFH
jgi:hypothetical protein